MYPLSDILYRSSAFDCFEVFEDNPNIKFYLSAILILIFCQGVAGVVPNMSSFLNIAGSVSGVIITIVLPLLFYNKAYKQEISTKRWIFNWVLIVLSLGLGIMAFIATVKEEMK
mmetsp:Transcript_6571/g.7320  ORF Transcript_6571/g.7320 Transcript_6571/m.7320 type:complete len:114 (-) Transcript_6571:22-363(-)